ncbi:MAG: MFS transporter [Burkholderiales bacterium]|jgi:predicted MFS family arabinose efflux permease|nr:MFS transporter [Burkholderiales bacterium]
MDPRLLALAVGNFVIATGMLVVPGMLNEMAADLGRPVTTVGQLTTAFAVAVALGAPLLAVTTTRIDRRALLVFALGLCAAAHVGAALAPGFAALVAARVAAGFAAALFTPQAAATVGLLVPPEKRGSAMAFVFLGFSVGNIAGLPIGTWVGAEFGWRATMLAVAAVAAAVMVWTRVALPARLAVAPLDRRAWGEIARHRALVATILVTVLSGTAQFVLFTYIAPAIMATGASATALGLLFMWFGVCGFVGNLVGARTIDRLGPPRVVLVSLAVMFAAFVLWPLTRTSLAATVVVIGLWGLGCFAANSAQQVRLVGLSLRLAPASVAFNSSAIYLGQALGAVLGALVIAAVGLEGLSYAGLAIFVAAIAMSQWATRLASRAAR